MAKAIVLFLCSKTGTEYIVNGGKGADFIVGNNAANTISAGKGNDTIRPNGGGNGKSLTDSTVKYNVLTGGDGADVFYFNPAADEHDIITDYTAGKDSIRLAEGLYISGASTTSSRATLTGQTGQATLNGLQTTVTAGGVELVTVKKKTVAATAAAIPNDVVLTISDSDGSVRGTITIWDAGGYEGFLSAASDVSVAAVSPYKITIDSEYTKKNKIAANTYAVDLVSEIITPINADGATIDASANNALKTIDAASKRKTAVYLIGSSKANSIAGTAKADTLAGNGASDGYDRLVGNAGNDCFLLDGKGDVLIEDYSSEKGNYDRIQLAEGVELTDGSASDNDLVMSYTFNGAAHHATLLGAANTKITVAGSDGKAGAQVYGGTVVEVANADGDKVDVTSNRKVQKIDASKRSKNVVLIGNTVTSNVLGGSKNDTIDTSALVITSETAGASINSGAGNDSVTGSMGDDEVTLGAGADTFYTGGGNDTVETGAGKDVIYYEGGHVVVTDYTAGQDVIQFQLNGTYAFYEEEDNMTHSIDTDGTTVILNLAEDTIIGGKTQTVISTKNSIRLLNAVNKKLTYIDKDGKTNTLTLSDPTIEVITNSNAGASVTAKAITKTVNASSRSNPIAITGSANTTSIKGGKGADTITLTASGGGTIEGAKGDDNLTGAAGKTFYAYTNGDGSDVITNYADGDVIVLKTSATTVNDAKSSVSGSDYVLTIGKGSITIKNGASKEIKVRKYADSTETTYNGKSEDAASMKAYQELFGADSSFTADDDLNEVLPPLSNVECGMRNAELSNAECGMRNAQLGVTSYELQNHRR